MKRWLALGIALVFSVGVAATSFADEASTRVELKKAQAMGKQLDAKLAAAKKAGKKANVAAIAASIKKNNAKVARLKAELAAASSMPMMEPSASAPAPSAPAPVVTRPAPQAPRYVASTSQYEIVGRVGYLANGFGVIGTISMPTVLNDVVKALGLDQIGLSGAGLAVGGGYVRGSNTTNNPANYTPLIANGILTFAADPSYTLYAEGGLNFPAIGTANGAIGGQVAVGAEMAVPELGGKVIGEVGWGIFRRTTIGSSSGVMANLGYKFAF